MKTKKCSNEMMREYKACRRHLIAVPCRTCGRDRMVVAYSAGYAKVKNAECYQCSRGLRLTDEERLQRGRESRKRWADANPEKQRESQVRYREANKERLKIEDKKRYDDNRDYRRQQGAKYYESNREHLLERRKEYYEADKENILRSQNQYRKANKEQVIQGQANYRKANRERLQKYGRGRAERLPDAYVRYKIFESTGLPVVLTTAGMVDDRREVILLNRKLRKLKRRADYGKACTG